VPDKIVKLVIAISPEHYDPFLQECEIGSREYTILKNAIVALSSNDGHERQIIQILSMRMRRLIFSTPRLGFIPMPLMIS
jgi:hypothetical protein